jgi:hypothetical protein
MQPRAENIETHGHWNDVQFHVHCRRPIQSVWVLCSKHLATFGKLHDPKERVAVLVFDAKSRVGKPESRVKIAATAYWDSAHVLCKVDPCGLEDVVVVVSSFDTHESFDCTLSCFSRTNEDLSVRRLCESLPGGVARLTGRFREPVLREAAPNHPLSRAGLPMFLVKFPGRTQLDPDGQACEVRASLFSCSENVGLQLQVFAVDVSARTVALLSDSDVARRVATVSCGALRGFWDPDATRLLVLVCSPICGAPRAFDHDFFQLHVATSIWGFAVVRVSDADELRARFARFTALD